MSIIYIGIDPGKNGGIAATDLNSVTAIAMPELAGLLEWFRFLVDNNNERIICCMEKVGGFAGRDETAIGSRMFNFGKSVGHVESVLCSVNIQPIEVHCNTWMRELNIPKKVRGTTQNQWKNTLREIAQELYPQLNVTLKTADALLILEYCKRKYGSTQQ